MRFVPVIHAVVSVAALYGLAWPVSRVWSLLAMIVSEIAFVIWVSRNRAQLNVTLTAWRRSWVVSFLAATVVPMGIVLLTAVPGARLYLVGWTLCVVFSLGYVELASHEKVARPGDEGTR